MYIVNKWAWQGHGDCWYLVLAEIFVFFNKIWLQKKMIRHVSNKREIDGENWESVSWILYLLQGMVVFILYGACHFVTWVTDKLILIIYYYTILLLKWFSLGYTDVFSNSSFQTMIIINWYMGMGCGIDTVIFACFGPNWHAY